MVCSEEPKGPLLCLFSIGPSKRPRYQNDAGVSTAQTFETHESESTQSPSKAPENFNGFLFLEQVSMVKSSPRKDCGPLL